MNKAGVLTRLKTADKSETKEKFGRNSIIASIKENGAVFLIAFMFIFGTLIALVTGNTVKQIMSNYSYNVLVILVAMELFTGLIAGTGIMQKVAVRLAELSKGRKRLLLLWFGTFMFAISGGLNNITAVMMILPIVFVLLKALECDEKYIGLFLATILSLSNTGGAASPIGDFPAIVIMTSGITSAQGYFSHALPLFLVTSLILLAIWVGKAPNESDDDGIRKLAVINLNSQYKNVTVRKDVTIYLSLVFVAMFVSWLKVPQSIIPPEIIAVLGFVCAAVICAVKKVKVSFNMNLKSLLTTASFLFFAEAVSETGVLSMVANYLQTHISNPKLLIIAIMLITSVIAGVFSAGPAAAAMMPIIVNICNTPEFSGQSDWIAVAYAAAICAGSSMFMWSATAGFILSGKVNEAQIRNEEGICAKWGVRQYLGYGLVNYVIQISVAILAMLLIL